MKCLLLFGKNDHCLLARQLRCGESTKAFRTRLGVITDCETWPRKFDPMKIIYCPFARFDDDDTDIHTCFREGK